MERITVVKIGGNVIDNPAAMKRFLKEFAALEGPKILVHGGGKLATRLAERLELKVQMVDGRRITDKGTLDVVTMVYAGLINKQAVAGLQAAGCNALGLSAPTETPSRPGAAPPAGRLRVRGRHRTGGLRAAAQAGSKTAWRPSSRPSCTTEKGPC